MAVNSSMLKYIYRNIYTNIHHNQHHHHNQKSNTIDVHTSMRGHHLPQNKQQAMTTIAAAAAAKPLTTKRAW